MMFMSFQRQRGLSLVELMVAMALSLLLMLGVIQIFLSSKQTYSTNSALSRVQENGRFAMEFLISDIRNIGYKGQCLGEPRNHLNTTDELFTLKNPIEGWEGKGSSDEQHAHLVGKGRLAKTDSIFIKFAGGEENFHGSSGNQTNTPQLGIDKATGITAGNIILVSDALGCDLFQSANNAESKNLQKSGSNVTPGNKSQDWSHKYTSEMEVLTLQNSFYYIREHADRLPSLVRNRLKANASNAQYADEELVEGVQDMQITYGITSGPSRQVTEYKSADEITTTEWESVASVRIELLVVSSDTNVTQEQQTIHFDGEDVAIAERRLAQVFTSTIGIRNRLP